MKKNKNEILWEETPITPNTTGAKLIAEIVKHLPNKPGVYRMINKTNEVLYVGKAKNLKKRVTAYARGKGHGGNRTTKMIAETTQMEFITTHTETESLLLEANLIKRLRPKFNVLLKDDKSFPYIYLDDTHEAPGIFKHRGARSKTGKFFGPFASAGAVTTTVDALQKIFLLRTCTDSFYSTRTRPCLQYQIKRCAAPCTGKIKIEEYQKLVKEAQDFLEGKSEKLKKQYAKRMQAASNNLDFETAALYRDRLGAFSQVQTHQKINPQTVKEADVFAVHEKAGTFGVQVFFFRTNQNWGNRAYYPKAHKTFGEDEVLSAFVSQFYDNKPIPKLVLLSQKIKEAELLQKALSAKAGHKVAVEMPTRGKKYEIVRYVEQNTKEALERRLAEAASSQKVMEGIAETFRLENPPERIEVYDNSHISGQNPVGAMIVATEDGFQKNQYRKFNIKGDISSGDDYAMMKEVLGRRFSKINEHQVSKTNEYQTVPDLVIIDGGKGQLSAATEVIQNFGIEGVRLVAIAKGENRNAGRETLFMEGRTPFKLNPRDPVLYFLQRLRDEAHRFAIGTHRARRKKQFTQNPLDEISGIGMRRKKALLLHFGSAKQTAKAGIEDLKKVEGISQQIAETIYNHFNEA